MSVGISVVRDVKLAGVIKHYGPLFGPRDQKNARTRLSSRRSPVEKLTDTLGRLPKVSGPMMRSSWELSGTRQATAKLLPPRQCTGFPYNVGMDTTPHWLVVLLHTVGELGFALVALPLYVFLVLPKYADGELPGFVPVIAEGVDPVLAVACALAVLIAGIAFAFFLVRVSGKTRGTAEETTTFATDYSMLDMAAVYAAAGFGEEFLFRVVCIDLIGPVLATILFTVAHFDYWKQPGLLVNVFVIGALLTCLYLYTRSLLLCTAIHFAYNMSIGYLEKKGIRMS